MCRMVLHRPPFPPFSPFLGDPKRPHPLPPVALTFFYKQEQKFGVRKAPLKRYRQKCTTPIWQKSRLETDDVINGPSKKSIFSHIMLPFKPSIDHPSRDPKMPPNDIWSPTTRGPKNIINCEYHYKWHQKPLSVDFCSIHIWGHQKALRSIMSKFCPLTTPESQKTISWSHPPMLHQEHQNM